MHKQSPIPERYWLYQIARIVCVFLLFFNFHRTDKWTGDKPFSEYGQWDWTLFIIFLVEELIIVGAIIVLTVLARRAATEGEINRRKAFSEEIMMMGIKPGDYHYVWFDRHHSARALVLKQDEVFKTYVEKYNSQTDEWVTINTVSVHGSLQDVKKSLFYDCFFYCDENAIFVDGEAPRYRED